MYTYFVLIQCAWRRDYGTVLTGTQMLCTEVLLRCADNDSAPFRGAWTRHGAHAHVIPCAKRKEKKLWHHPYRHADAAAQVLLWCTRRDDGALTCGLSSGPRGQHEHEGDGEHLPNVHVRGVGDAAADALPCEQVLWACITGAAWGRACKHLAKCVCARLW